LYKKKEWRTLKPIKKKLKDPNPEFKEFRPQWHKFLAKIPAGGCWIDLPPKM